MAVLKGKDKVCWNVLQTDMGGSYKVVQSKMLLNCILMIFALN